MEELKFSQMPLAGPLVGNEMVPILQSGVNKLIPAEALKGQDGADGTDGVDGDQGPPGEPEAPGTPAPVVDDYYLDIYDWAGDQAIADGVFLNFASLPLVKKAGSTAGTAIASNAVKFPTKNKPSSVVFVLRITGTIGGSTSQAREWRIQMRRPDGTIVGSVADLKITGTAIVNRDVTITSHTWDANDPFSVTGIQLGLHNVSTQAMTITALSIRVHRTVNPE